MYPLWKIEGAGSIGKRYYEDRGSFTRSFNKFTQEHPTYYTTSKGYVIGWRAYQYSTEGWVEIPRPTHEPKPN